MAVIPKELADQIGFPADTSPPPLAHWHHGVDVLFRTMACPHCKGPLTTLKGSEHDPDFVYFVQRKSGPIKIGLSRRPVDRMMQIMGDVGEEITILALVLGSREAERSLHIKFKHLRIEKEWFRPEPELIEFIRRMPNNAIRPKETD